MKPEEIHLLSCDLRQLALEKMMHAPTRVMRAHYGHDILAGHLIEDLRRLGNIAKYGCGGAELHVKAVRKLLHHTTRELLQCLQFLIPM